MSRTKRSKKAGLAPGTLMHIGREKSGSRVEIIEYDPTHLQKLPPAPMTACLTVKPAPVVTWINVEGLSEIEVMQHFGNCFGIHSLVLEDILATDQRPKAEDYGEYLYVVLKMLTVNRDTEEITSEQVSLVLGDNYLISFQEGFEGDVFEQVRARLNNPQARIRQAGPDFLLHALLDVMVDNYFLVLERLAERIETLEDELIEKPDRSTLHEIYRLKQEMLYLHKVVWPLREVVGRLQRRDSPLITEGTMIYLRDLYDHTVQALDTLETLRDMISGMLDIYLTSVSNRLNEVMKVLTIIATIFMPLSFLVGWYGMNFKNMHEYDWPYSYPILLAVMGTIAGGMVVFFKKKQWL